MMPSREFYLLYAITVLGALDLALTHRWFKKHILPSNQFCREEVFPALSKTLCTLSCLKSRRFDSCTAIHYQAQNNGTMGNCECGRPLCSDSGVTDNTPTEVLVDKACDRFDEGKVFSYHKYLTK